MHNYVNISNVRFESSQGSESSPSSPYTPDSARSTLNIDDSFDDLGHGLPRPMGKKKSKALEKRKSCLEPGMEKLEVEMKERLSKSQDNFDAFLGLQREKLAMKAKSVQLKNDKIKMKEMEIEMLKKRKDEEIEILKNKSEHEILIMREIKLREEEDRLNYTNTSSFSPAMLVYHNNRLQEMAKARVQRNNGRG